MLNSCPDSCTQLVEGVAEFDTLLSLVCNNYNFACIGLLEKEIFSQLNNIYTKKSNNTQTVWKKTCESLRQTLASNFCNAECNLNKNLQLVTEVINMAIRVQLSLQNICLKQRRSHITTLFDADTEFVFVSVTKIISHHFKACQKPISVQTLLEAISACSFTCADRNLVLLFKLITSLITKQPGDRVLLEKQGLRGVYDYLSTHDIDNKTILKQLLCLFCSLNSDLHAAKDRSFIIKAEAMKLIESLPHDEECIETVCLLCFICSTIVCLSFFSLRRLFFTVCVF